MPRSALRIAVTTLGAIVTLLLGVELGLRALGVASQRPASRLLYQQVFTPVLAPTQLPNGETVLATTDPRIPFQWVAPTKAENSLRIFVFGGSAAAGLGYSPNVTFARELERQLAAAYPQREVEVVNFAIVALASRQVLALVRDAVSLGQPDWVLVYSGNNEFLEPHSEAFANLGRSAPKRWARALADSRLARVLTKPRRVDPRTVEESISTRALAQSENRVAHRELLREVEFSAEQEAEVLAHYRANLTAIARAARAAGSQVILSAPAVNWRWRGMEDRPADWIEQRLRAAGSDLPANSPEGLARAIELLDLDVARAEPKQLWERLHERAEVHETYGDWNSARRDWRASMNADPHRRRALDRHTELAREAAEATQTLWFDAVAWIESRSPAGIVGFEHFYDYVHPTPEGCLALAEGFFASVARVEGSTAPEFDLYAHGAKRRSYLAPQAADALDVAQFLGIGADTKKLASRDLWKADRALDELDQSLTQDPSDWQALAWRGNFRFFHRDGLEAAERDYRASLAIRPHPEVEANLARLLSDRRPGR